MSEYKPGNNLLNIIAFSVLMGGAGVLTKSPEYIIEKFGRYTGIPGHEVSQKDSWRWGLDSNNQQLLAQYAKEWKFDLPDYWDEKGKS